MSKSDVLAAFEIDLSNPGSIKSGEFLSANLIATARRFLAVDRQGLLDALHDWIAMRSDPKSMLAVDVVGELRLGELAEDLDQLKHEIAARTVFLPFYQRRIDLALSKLKPATPR